MRANRGEAGLRRSVERLTRRPRAVRVLFVSAALNVGGSERQWASLVSMLRSRGFEPEVLTLFDEGVFHSELAAAGVPTTCARIAGRSDLLGLARIAWQQPAGDLVVSQSLAGQVLGHAIARRAGVPHVTTEHGAPGLPRRPHERFLLRLLAPHVDAVVAVTNAQVPALARLAFDRARIRVIWNGVPEIGAASLPPSFRSELGVGTDDFVAVLAATIRPEKRVEVFVEAVARAHALEPRIRGLVVGGGPGARDVAELTASTNGVVRALGHREDVANILSAADAVCLTSSVEALPMVILEAMAHSKPVVATDVGGIDDAVRDGETGLLVGRGDPDDVAAALVRLAREDGLAESLGRAGRSRQLALFGADRMAESYASLLQSVAQAQGR